MNEPPKSNAPSSPPAYREVIYQRYLSTRVRDAFNHPPPPGGPAAGFFYYEAKLAKWLPQDRDSAILDLGCGAGAFLQWLGRRGFHRLTGIDLSPEQISLARQAAPTADIRQENLFGFLEGKPGQYHLIAALDVIEHFDKEQVLKFLELIFESLAPGGRLILQTPNAASPWGMSLRWGDFTHGCCFTPRSLSQLLALAGFEQVQVQAAGPVPHGLKSGLRWAAWSVISAGYALINLVEMGARGDGIYTRVFQAGAVKPGDNKGNQP